MNSPLGVTMAEKGVFQLFSVDLQTAGWPPREAV